MLEVPYSDDRELLRDILKHGPDVEVLGPEALRARVREALAGGGAALLKMPFTRQPVSVGMPVCRGRLTP